MPTPRPHVVSDDERKLILRRRLNLRQSGSRIRVEYTRYDTRLTDPYDRRTARFIDAEDAIIRLCKDHDRRHRQPGDTNRARTLISLIDDCFLT